MLSYLLLITLVNATIPNFILMVADDLGYNDLSSFGSPTIRTPNIDKLVLEGLKFTQFYTPGPLCTPSRGSMFTGRLPIKSGLYTKYGYPEDKYLRIFYPTSVGCLPSSEKIISEFLKYSKHKYYTAMFGKWHLGHNPNIGCLPLSRGFDFFYGLPYSHEEGYPGDFPESIFWSPVPLFNGNKIVQQPVNLSSLTSRYTQKALNLLDNFAQTKQPFFMHIAYEQPHIPLFASSNFINTSRRGSYGDSVEEMDYSIGQIINKLINLELHRDTLVMFVSDNGAWIDPISGFPNSPQPLNGGSNAPFYDGKGSTWEGGVRIPAVLWWPETIKPNTTLEVASVLDFLPTILELADIPIPDNLDGYSLVPRIYNKNFSSPYQFFYFFRENVLYAIRYGPWKAHYYTRPGFGSDPPVYNNPPLFFNIEYDPSERYPFNISDFPDIYSIIDTQYLLINNTIERGIPQYGPQNFTLLPCCHGNFNETEYLEFIENHQWSLALWEKLGCVCTTEIEII